MSFDERPESSSAEMTWRTRSDRAGTFISPAVSRWELVVWTFEGETNVTVRGPETKATLAEMPADVDFFGIQLRLGTFMPQLPTADRVDGDLLLPKATERSVWLGGSAWQIPAVDEADVFVKRLERQGLLVRDPLVTAIVRGEGADVSPKTVRRRFLNATGLTPKTVQQIERARRAAALLERGCPIADAVYLTGYADQPHLTRALRRFLGRTPAQLLRPNTAL